MKKCFECGNEAAEDHHVIPKVMGGTKTVPLCTSCHMKVHGLDGTKRADNHKENIKRGIDKNRVWQLFAIYQIMVLDKVTEPLIIQSIYLKNYKEDISLDSINRLVKRVSEMDTHYIRLLFDEYIDQELSHHWNDDDAEIYLEILISNLYENLETMSNSNNKEHRKISYNIFKNTQSRFLEYKKSN